MSKKAVPGAGRTGNVDGVPITTQTPQQPQWEARYSPDVGWYVRHGEDVEATWYPELANKARELADYLNAQQQRIEALEAALREAQMHIRADCPACKAGYPRIVTEGGHGSKFTTHPMTYEQSLALEEHLTYFMDTGYVFCSAGWAQWEKDFLTKLNALLSPSEAK